ncbi:flagellar assembly regulator FliX [Caulobacter sp. NIBR2454]|uniref:flagellar assembly regulator FliX n=1 Tax=Caulobacter sp. NIBR2454 TaxID=3015996 RepID=UPI0022B6F40E|nr:flagellar assembly protein FliX [Caulobacter sp. NIBR2454]
MKVSGSSGAGSVGGAGRAKGASSGGGFSLPAVEEAAASTGVGGAGGVTGVASVDALLAMQAVGTPLDGRRRAVKRAGRILDVLEEVKMAMLDGGLSAPQLQKLARVVRDQRDSTDDPGLESLLDQIETRAAVELAKFEMSQRAMA